ncbi:MAG TPA: stage II sporulation protein E, partial [Lentisphaeria bacterium]|nr:stage II sporulation protein E [Lentisphaeria bacterium]
VVTGPPFSQENDKVMADFVRNFNGRIIVSGGTTAGIVARELDVDVRINLDLLDPEVPPISHMKGVDLVTEGTITLAKVTEMLERGAMIERLPKNGATMILELFRNSDIIQFLVGTRINEAHQDPNVPMELDLRRTLMKRLARLLEEKYLKETRIQFI